MKTLTSGQFTTKPINGHSVLIEWEKINPKSPQLTEKIRLLSPLLIRAYSEIEFEFAQKNPREIENDMFLKSLAPLLTNGIMEIDWNKVKTQIISILSDFFIKMDWSMYTKPNDSHFFVVVKDKISGAPLGMMQFIISPEYARNNVKIELYDGVNLKKTDLDLQKILLSSIFKLMPNTDRIFFHTRISNLNGIKAHEKLGFSRFQGELPTWIDLEYLADETKILQEFALTLSDQI